MNAVTPAGGDSAAARTWPRRTERPAGRPGPRAPTTPPGRWTGSCAARPPTPRSPASRSRCGPRARRSRRSPASSGPCTRTPTLIEVPGRTVDIVGTGGDRRQDGQHLHDVRDRGGRHRRQGRQARQPGRVLRQRRLRRAGEARRQSRPHPAAGRRGRRGGGHHLLLRGEVPPGAAACGHGPQGAGHPPPRSTSSAR